VPSFAADDAVTRELDAYVQDQGLSRENLSSSDKKFPRKRHEFEFGMERYSYLYREYVNGSEFVRTEGDYTGFILSYAFRPPDVDTYKAILNNIFRMELRYAIGEVDYTGSGTWDNLDEYMYEVRAIVGEEFFLNPSLRAIPYVGLGYRYLNNGAEDMPARVIDGQPYYSGYNRESEYWYIPIGVDVQRHLSGGWVLGGSLEYDLWIGGQQTSHFEDMIDVDGVPSGWDPMENEQNGGYGLRGSLKLEKVFPRMKLGIEPYYRYWKVEDSEVESATGPGAPTASGFYEPENKTEEIGVKVGIKF